MNKEEVLKLATLARIEVSDAEVESLTREFEAIIKYVSEVREISTADNKQQTIDAYPIKNVLREDTNAHKSGIYTEDILNNAPARDGQYIKVKKIL